MLHILIDTNILDEDPQRKSAAFQVVSRVGNAGELTVHIPQVVKLEFLNHRENEYLKPLEKAESGFDKISKKPLSESLKESLKKQKNAINNSISDVKNWVHKEFEYWCAHIGAKIHQIGNHHSSNVFDSYFSGAPPFKAIKNRKDLPDAFIYESIKDVANEVNELNVIVADKKLQETCNTLDNVTTFESLDNFVKTKSFKEVVKDTVIEQNFDILIDELKKHSSQVEKDASDKIFDTLAGYSFSDPIIPDDNNEATISMLDVPENAGLMWEEALYYGSGIVDIPFEFEMTTLVYYHIFKADWYIIDEERAKSISVSEYGNRHFFEAEEEFEVFVKGSIAISLDISKAETDDKFWEELPSLINSMEIETSEIADVSIIHEKNT